MHLYELRVRDKGCNLEVEYMPTIAEVKKKFNEAKRGGAQLVVANKVTVNTALKTVHWIELLNSDSPGRECSLTPVDFIVKRREVRKWESACA